MITINNRASLDPSQEKNVTQKTDWLIWIGYLFLPVLFGLSWIRYELGSKPVFPESEVASYALATFLVFCNYLFPAKGYKAMSVFIFLISLFFSLSATTESIDKVFEKNKKSPLSKQTEKPTLPNCPSAKVDWNTWHECFLKFPQAEKERLEYNQKVGEYNNSLPAKNTEIEKFNSELSYAKLSLQSQITIILYILLAIGIPTIEMYSVYVFHNKTESGKGTETTKPEIKFIFPWTQIPIETAMSQLCKDRKWDTKTATLKLQGLGFSNSEIGNILQRSKSAISKAQIELRTKQPKLIALPRKDKDQQDLFKTGTEANHAQLST